MKLLRTRRRLVIAALLLAGATAGSVYALSPVFGPILFKSYNPSIVSGGGTVNSTNYRAVGVRVGVVIPRLAVEAPVPTEAKNFDSYR